jgi:hypothetical protein
MRLASIVQYIGPSTLSCLLLLLIGVLLVQIRVPWLVAEEAKLVSATQQRLKEAIITKKYGGDSSKDASMTAVLKRFEGRNMEIEATQPMLGTVIGTNLYRWGATKVTYARELYGKINGVVDPLMPDYQTLSTLPMWISSSMPAYAVMRYQQQEQAAKRARNPENACVDRFMDRTIIGDKMEELSGITLLATPFDRPAESFRKQEANEAIKTLIDAVCNENIKEAEQAILGKSQDSAKTRYKLLSILRNTYGEYSGRLDEGTATFFIPVGSEEGQGLIVTSNCTGHVSIWKTENNFVCTPLQIRGVGPTKVNNLEMQDWLSKKT